MVIILLICLIALIVGSCFGLFFGSESTGTGTSVTQAVADLNGEYQAYIQAVSYTHLDVYKRQPQHQAHGRWRRPAL